MANKKKNQNNLKRIRINKNIIEDYIDNFKYATGVKDHQTKELVIRPLTKEELSFLVKFNTEYYHGIFSNDGNDIFKKGDFEEYKKVKKQISNIKKRLSKKKLSDEEVKEMQDELTKLEELSQKLNPRKICTDNSNARMRCVLNRSKIQNSLIYIDKNTLEKNNQEDEE